MYIISFIGVLYYNQFYIMLQMVHVSGKIALEGKLAYVTQQAWIMNTTVRENILFGEDFDAERYGIKH